MATTQQVSQQGVVAALPFTASAHEHIEPAFTLTVTPGAAVTQLNPQDIPAYGYIRSVILEVSASGGAGGTIAADGPWNLIQSLTLQDVNGANIVGPIDGYSLYLANLVGGYSGIANDPAMAPDTVLSAPNPTFLVRVPVEISAKDGLGALANQNAAANYKLSLAINSLAAAFSVAPGTPPTLTIRGWLEAWTLPAPQDNRGRPQAQIPPLLGTGQYWSQTTRSVLAGSNTLGITRVGNYLRNVVLVGRDVSGVRSNNALPDPLQFNWDGNQIHNTSQRVLRTILRERLIQASATLPTGVLVLPFGSGGSGRLGNEDPNLWLPTTQSSRLEISGSSAAAGSVQMIVNEVAPVEVNQAERYEVPSDSGRIAA